MTRLRDAYKYKIFFSITVFVHLCPPPEPLQFEYGPIRHHTNVSIIINIKIWAKVNYSVVREISTETFGAEQLIKVDLKSGCKTFAFAYACDILVVKKYTKLATSIVIHSFIKGDPYQLGISYLLLDQQTNHVTPSSKLAAKWIPRNLTGN